VDDGALAQVAQGTHGVSILGDTQKLSGHGPGQSSWRLVALLDQYVGPDVLQRSLTTSFIP